MASKKVSTLNALTSAGDDDLLYIADTSDSGASYASKRITVQNFLNGTASANALATEISDRTSGDTALSNRLDVLEADPTTATDVASAIAVETAARQAADALALPLAGGTMTGDIELGSGGGGPATATLTIKSVIDFGPNYENITVSLTASSANVGSFFASDDPSDPGSTHIAGEWGTFSGSIDGVQINENALKTGNAFTPGKRWWAFGYGASNSITITLNSTESFTSYSQTGFDYNTPVVHGGGSSGGATTIGADGSASFGGNISASTAPTDDAHLVNKLYADNLVAGVDLSGIATNTAAIAAETTARQAADALKLDLAGGTVTGNITASTVPTANGHLVNKLYADNLVAGVDLSGIATNAAAIEALTNGAPELLNTLAELGDAIGDDENFATTIANQISNESTTRASADTALSNRLDTLEADPTTQTDLDAEAAARIAADAQLMPKAGGTFTGAISGPAPTSDLHLATKKYADDLVANVDLSQVETNRLDIAAETTARTNADTALSGRLDTLEADPTTQTLLDAETTARTEADALKLDIAGGTMTGALEIGAAGDPEFVTTGTGAFTSGHDAYVKPVGETQYLKSIRVEAGGAAFGLARLAEIKVNMVRVVGGGTVTGDAGGFLGSNQPNNAIDNNQSTRAETNEFILVELDPPVEITDSYGGKVQIRAGNGNTVTTTITSSPTGGGGGAAATTIGVDGTATFGGNVSASAVPSDDAHLVNKLYADNLVAGVDLSGIATNAAAISALTNGAPELLNTLNELAEAIGDDENFATTVTNQISAEAVARSNSDTALSNRLATLEADPTTQSLLDAETAARQNADTAETNARTSADTALSGRLDTLEADPTTGAALTAETNARTSADTALSNRLDTLELDPTTQTLLDAEATARANADTAEASARAAGDAAEATARAAADALLLPLAGGTMTGALEIGSAGDPEYVTTGVGVFTGGVHDAFVKPYDDTAYLTSIKVEVGTASIGRARLAEIKVNMSRLTGGGTVSHGGGGFYGSNVGNNALDSSNTTMAESQDYILVEFNPPVQVTNSYGGKVEVRAGDGNVVTTTISSDPNGGGGGGAATTINVDGTATFGGNVTSDAVPSDDTHLVNKLYADNLVSGVDLSGIATNAAAIEALTNGAPDLLNTLNELANAIGDDENFAATVTGQISAETTARTNADNALSGRLDTLEADPTTQAALTAESVARTNADNALSGRLDTLEADPTTATALAAEATTRANADTALSGRLDTLENDATTQTLLDAEATARANADTLLDGRLDILEADPTTATALSSEATTRANADTALSGRLDTLEADPTTATSVANAVAAETAARTAADALLLPLAGGTMTGAINLGSGSSGPVTTTLYTNNDPAQDAGLSVPSHSQWKAFVANDPIPDGKSYVEITLDNTFARLVGGVTDGNDIRFHYTGSNAGIHVFDVLGIHALGPWNRAYEGNTLAYENASPTVPAAGDVLGFLMDKDNNTISYFYNGSLLYSSTVDMTGANYRWGFSVVNTTATVNFGGSAFNNQPAGSQGYGGGGGSGGATTIGTDGSASFGGNVSAEAVPTADAHLVNKLYADNLVSGVDLSGIATNAAAIQALTNGAPELLNTLQELASALGDDANFSTTVTGQIAANEVHIDNAATLSGVAKDSTNLGAFTGSTISGTSNIKAALQALETAIETPSAASQIQTIEQTANGTFHVTFVDSNNGSATAESLFTDSGLTYNPSTDLLSGGSVDMTKFFFDGTEVTATGAELNFLGGLTSGVQTQLDGKVTTGANISALVGDTTAGDVPVDVNGTDNYLFLVIDKANGALTAIDKTFLEAE